MRVLFYLAFVVFLSGVSAQAQSPFDAAEVVQKLSVKTASSISRRPEQLLERALRIVFDVSADVTLTQGRFEIYKALFIARGRARQVGEILLFELNGDLAIDKEEIDRILRHGSNEEKRQVLTNRFAVDADLDGALSSEEITSHVAAKAHSTAPQGELFQDLLQFDLDANGTVTLGEIDEAVRLLAAHVKAEANQPVQVYPDICTLPRPTMEAHVVFLSCHEGEALSTVTVSGQDVVTTAVTVFVEKEETPVYIVANALSSVVWNVTGATERVQAFVGNVNWLGTGVSGLDAGRLHLMPAKECVPGFIKSSVAPAEFLANQLLEEHVGWSLTEVVSPYSMGTFSVPSGAHTLPEIPRRSDGNALNGGAVHRGDVEGQIIEGRVLPNATSRMKERLRRDLDRLYPGEVFEVAPEDVVASDRAQAYEVLPLAAGLLQLIETRALLVTHDGTFFIWSRIPRFPAGLNGPFNVAFLLGTNVPMPPGDPQSAAVYDAKTGQCLLGAACPK